MRNHTTICVPALMVAAAAIVCFGVATLTHVRAFGASLPTHDAFTGRASVTYAVLAARSRSAYHGVHAFKQTVTVSGAYRFDVNARAKKVTARAVITYRSPDLLRIDGVGLFGDTYGVISNGRSVWAKDDPAVPQGWKGPAIPGSGWRRDGRVGSLAAVLKSMAGISGGATSLVPLLLVGDTAHVRTVPAEITDGVLNGRPAYRVHVTGGATSWTEWYDRQTYFLMQIRTTSSDRKFDGIVTYGTPKVDQPVPASIFMPPNS